MGNKYFLERKMKMNKKRQAIIAALLVAVLVAVPVFANVTGLADVSEVLAADDAEEKLPDYFLDLSEGLKADTDYDGISVGADMPVVSGKDPVSFTLNEEDYTSLYTVQGGDPKATPNDGAIPTEGTYVKVEPKRDGTFTIVTNYIGSSSAKKIWFVRNNAGVGETVESFDTDTEKADVKSYEVKEGETYYFYAKGSNVMIAGLGIKYEEEKNNVPDYFIDLSGGLKAGEDYNGISVGADMEDKNKEPVVFTLDGEKYTSLYTVQGSDPKATPNDGAIPTEGTYVKVEPKRDGTFTIVTNYIGSGTKTLWFVRDNAGTGETVESFGTSADEADVKSYEVKAGETYYFYAKGSNVMIAGIGIKYDNTDDETFVAVTGITGVAIEMTAGETITLSGTVAPDNATNKYIVWSVKDAGTTGATIADGKLTATSAGMVVVTATIENGLTATTPYTQDFTITVKAADDLELGDVDGSGTVDAGDALAILKNIVKLKLDKFIAELADVDQNGKINADDALAILKSLVNIEE